MHVVNEERETSFIVNSNVRKNLVVDMIEIREIDNNSGSSLFH